MATGNPSGFLKSSKKSYDLELAASVSKDIQAPESKFQNDTKQPFLKCRYIVGFVAFMCMFLYGNVSLNMSVNIVAMVNNSAVARRAKFKSDSCPLLLMPNSTQAEKVEVNEDGEFLWSPEMQGYILGSFNLGVFLPQVPGGRLVDKYGCKWFLLSSAFVTSAATFLMPVIAWMSAEALIALQLIRGLAQQTIEQWNKVFFIGIGVVMSSGIVYCIFGSADVQPWNFVEDKKDEEKTEPKNETL